MTLQHIIQEKCIAPLQALEPRHYFYPTQTLHLTIKNIRVSSDPPRFDANDIQKAIEVFSKIIPHHQRIRFTLKGLLLLPTSIGIRGYCDESLYSLIQELDQGLTAAGIPDDKMYASQDIRFGNITFCRYNSTPGQVFQERLLQLHKVEIGELEVSMVQLITTNISAVPDRTTVHKKVLLA